MKPVKYTIARYACSNGISSKFLTSAIRKIIVALNRYNLLVINIVRDGASENRTACRNLATLTAEDVFGKEYFSANQNKVLLLDLKIAFRHPIRSHILIFIGGDMPHLIKKFAKPSKETDSSVSEN